MNIESTGIDRFKYELLEAHRRETLIIDKHNPYNLGKILTKRSVISFDITNDAPKFIEVGIDKVFEYSNSKYPRSPRYLEIVPTEDYSIASSGVISYSETATYALDRIVAVYGNNIGLHLYGESSNNIYRNSLQNTLRNKFRLK